MRPTFHSVIDLGLRDVGVRNQPRRLAAHFGRRMVPMVALAFLFAIAPCLLLRQAGAGPWAIAAFVLAWTIAVLVLVLRAVVRAPVAVVTVTAEGRNHMAWIATAPFLLVAAAAALARDATVVPLVALTLTTAALAWRGRRRVPDMLRALEPLLAIDEAVAGDGIGLARGAARGRALRLIVATDRRLLVTGPGGDAVLDAPYAHLGRFGIAWKSRGRMGVLSLTLAGETRVITAITPANLLSIARALHAHGVPTDDTPAIAEAERAWEDALTRSTTREPWLDRAAMRTQAFDRGLWLLLGVAVAVFYVNPFGIGLGAARDAAPAFLVIPFLCGVCGYVAGTPSSLAYLAPLNLLVVPAFFFFSAGTVAMLMLVLSTAATVGLCSGAAIRGRASATPAREAARGSLRDVLSGRGLIRISALLLVLMLGLVATSAAAGFQLTDVRLALEEATAKHLPVDGRSNEPTGAALLTYTPRPGLKELITHGADWELRSPYADGYNAVTLGAFDVEPRLDSPAAVAAFVALKDRAHTRLAGFPVGHATRVVDGRTGYVWKHGSRSGFWYFSAWFPAPGQSVRVECITRSRATEFRALCGEAMGSLRLR